MNRAGKGGGRTWKDQTHVDEAVGLRVRMEEIEQPPETATAIGPAARAGLSQSKPCEEWICDSGAAVHMTFDVAGMRNYRQCSKHGIRVASGELLPVAGYGDIHVVFLTDGRLCKVTLTNVAYVPKLCYNLFSLKAVNKKGHRFIGMPSGKIVLFEGDLSFPIRGDAYSCDAFRVPEVVSTYFSGSAVLAPGNKSPTSTDINAFHCSYAHVNEELLRATARKLGVTLTGKLNPCIGCSMAKGLRKAIHKTTSTRANKKLGRVFVDLCGPKPVSAAGGKRYMMIIRDDFTRFTWLKFLRNKLDAADAFKEFLADTRTEGDVEIVRSDGGGRVSGAV